MKRFIAILTAFVMIVSLTGVAFAGNQEIKVYLEGYKISFDVQPQTINGRTMVPIRAIFEAMGATVNWDASTKTAVCTKDNTTVKMTLNSTVGYINGTAFKMDVTPVIMNGRTLAPARYVAEAFGYYVNWDNMTRSVLISKEQNFSISQIKDGTRNHPFKLGDKVTVNVFNLGATEPKTTFDITPRGILSPAEMEKLLNTSEYYTYDKDTWYLKCDVSLKYNEDDAAYSFVDFILLDFKFVTSSGSVQDASLSVYKNPSEYEHLELYAGGSSECYIPIETDELAGKGTVDYLTITTFAGNGDYSKQKTVWFYLR